jgi:LacI family transcriptional regulator
MPMPEAPRVVLLMIPFTGYDRGLLDGIARYAQVHGPWVFYLSGDYPEVPLPAPDSLSGTFQWPDYALVAEANAPLPFPNLRRWQAGGVIGRIQSTKIAKRILASGLPVIAIDLSEEQLVQSNPLSRISEIRADSRQAGRLAAEHFLERGFRNFAFCGYQGRIWSQHRQEGYCDRLREAGYSCAVFEPQGSPQPRSVRATLRTERRSLSWNWEQPMVAAWLKSLPRPVALMACSDIRGRQVLEASLMQGLDVPDDVAIVGVDDDHLICNLTNPPLSSVAFNLEQAGYRAAELLDGLMRGKVRQPQRIMVESMWVVARRSTDVFATEDRHVGAALRFIRDNARQSINVDDVVRQAGPSRRGLEIRFHDILGRSIRSEIQRARLTYTKQLLVETNLPTQRIAALVGFSSLQYLSNVFRREIGMTLAQFRRRMRVP